MDQSYFFFIVQIFSIEDLSEMACDKLENPNGLDAGMQSSARGKFAFYIVVEIRSFRCFESLNNLLLSRSLLLSYSCTKSARRSLAAWIRIRGTPETYLAPPSKPSPSFDKERAKENEKERARKRKKIEKRKKRREKGGPMKINSEGKKFQKSLQNTEFSKIAK